MSTALAELHRDLQDLVGRTIAERYRVDALIGVGGMAVVFRAHHLGLGRDVAVKLLHPHMTENPEVSARFDREARSASRLDHPNCVQVTDFGSTEQGTKFMVMQLLEGGELTQILEKPVPAKRAVELTLQILRGLEHAHKQGVIHRDVKPENVFVTSDHADLETLKLVDFGIAKIVGAASGDTHKTTVGLVFGTPAYMSPEQAMGVEADARSDLYSTGVILYQMLAGKLPHDHEDPVSLVRMQVSRSPEPLPSSVPPVLAGFVERLLQKDRDERFPSATQAIATLEELGPLLAGQGRISHVELTPAANTATPEPLRRATTYIASLATAPRWKLAAGAGFVLVVALWAAFSGDDEAVTVETSTAVAGEDPDRDMLRMVQQPSEPGPPLARLAEIDALLLAKRPEDADALLAPLRDEFPGHASLLWRQGRLLAMRKRKQPQALAAYGDALQVDPTLLQDKDFYAELHDLLRHRRVRDEALDLALQHMGETGHKFLVELVNNESRPLKYNDRHRALDELATDPRNGSLIDRRLNLALDIMQASSARTPCAAYAQALDDVEAEPDYFYYRRVEKGKRPDAPTSDPSGEEAAKCEGLAERRLEVLTLLAKLEPIDETSGGAQGEPEAAGSGESQSAPAGRPAGERPKKKSTARSGPDCSKFGAFLNKKCRR